MRTKYEKQLAAKIEAQKLNESREVIPEENEDEEKTNCKHNWQPAGARKNRDRVHNRMDGNGKYQAYKCEICGKFKRRYFK